jgi:hypothetical protein
MRYAEKGDDLSGAELTYAVIALPQLQVEYMERAGELYQLQYSLDYSRVGNKYNDHVPHERPCGPNIRARGLLLQPRPGPHPAALAHSMGPQPVLSSEFQVKWFVVFGFEFIIRESCTNTAPRSEYCTRMSEVR